MAVKNCAINVAAQQSARNLNQFVFGEAAKEGAKEAFGKTAGKYAALETATELANLARDVGEVILKKPSSEDYN